MAQAEACGYLIIEMNGVTVHFYATLRDKLGLKEATAAPGNVAEILSELKRALGRPFSDLLYVNGRVNERYIILVRGKRVFQHDVEKVMLSPGDILDVFPPVAGG